MTMDYKQAGVDIDAGNEAVRRIKPLVQKTFGPHVMGSLGHFASMVALPSGYKEPVLVSCTDGVGTKLKLAIDLQDYSTIGIDLVAMSVNDLICCGARPLYFLDYIACHHLDPVQIESLVGGMTTACIESGCSLVGGEMAEMGDVYQSGEFDLAGFAVGIVEKSNIIDGSQAKPGDTVYALPSSGLHSNGFSLARKLLTKDICHKAGFDYKTLLTPTRLYPADIAALLDAGKTLTSIAHITGGGIAENFARVLPANVRTTLEKRLFPTLPVFDLLKTLDVLESELYRVFNMGIGLIVTTPDTLAFPWIPLGKLDEGPEDVALV